ncbi:hypothetical protein GGS20DRAFT_518042 [Poronia punctata]|nr:hypothetical protein GGS20DRAFT_518042 [Poronia punctata]
MQVEVAPQKVPLPYLRLAELPREAIAQELQKTNLDSLVDSINEFLSVANVKFRRALERHPKIPHDGPRPNFQVEVRNERVDPPLADGGEGNGMPGSLSSTLFANQAAVIGGAIVRNIDLIISKESENVLQYGNLAVFPIQVPMGYSTKLYSGYPRDNGQAPPSILLFSEPYIAPPGFADTNLFFQDGGFNTTNFVAAGSTRSIFQEDMQHAGLMEATLGSYTLSGDIDNFWGVPGLTAKLYKHNGAEQTEGKTTPEVGGEKDGNAGPVREKVIIDVKHQALSGQPILAKLLPYIDCLDMTSLPIANLELTYSEEKSNNPLYQPGLCLELDVQLNGSLQWVSDAIKNLFGSSEHPRTIHLSALLSQERNWSRPPTIENLVLRGYLDGASLKAWNLLEFQTLGMEFSALKSNGSWNFGFGFIGEVALIGIPEAKAPLKLSYRLARDVVEDESGNDEGGSEGQEVEEKQKAKPGHIWNLTIDASQWKGIFGYKIDLESATLFASFEEGHFTSSITLDLEGTVKLGHGSCELHGRFSKGLSHCITWTWMDVEAEKGDPMKLAEYYIEASIGELTLSEIETLYRQITGDEIEKDSKEQPDYHEELTFRAMRFRISSTKYADDKLNRTALDLSGEVTIGDTTSYAGRLTFGTDGVTITGAVDNVRIPRTDIVIEEAGLKAFLALGRGKSNNAAKNSFSIQGIIKYHEVKFQAGFYTAKEEDGSRDWLVFGSAQSIKLREAWPSIPQDNFLNLVLDHVTVIASSKSRMTSKTELPNEGNGGNASESHNPTESEEQKDTEMETDNGDHDNWDVLAKIKAYDYPVKQGFQICATISKCEQLEQLNKGRKIDGLILSLTYDKKESSIAALIDLPKSFDVTLSPSAHLSDFSASVAVDSVDGPRLELGAALTINLQDSAPIKVYGILKGTFKGMDGQLSMDPSAEWDNPFNLNTELILSKLGMSIGFNYATVFELGPTRAALQGDLRVGNDFKFHMNVGIDVTKAAAVLDVDISRLDIADIVKIANTLAHRDILTEMARSRGVVVFSNIKLYLSSGATFLGEYWSRGIEVRGQLDFFGKHGDFDGSFTDDGVVVRGGLDAFKVGGLEVTSWNEYKGKKRATIDIEATKSTQKVLVDGIIRYDKIELQVYINADLENQILDFNIVIKLTDAIKFTLNGTAEARNSKELQGATVEFEATLEADILKIIGDGIIEGIQALEHQANRDIEQGKANVKKRLGQLHDQLAAEKEELDKMKRESDKRIKEKNEGIRATYSNLEKLKHEVDEAELNYKKAKANKDGQDAAVKAQMVKRDAAQARLSAKKRELKEEYDRQIKEQKTDQEHWEAERQRLEAKKDAEWGDDIRKGNAARENLAHWTKVENEKESWLSYCQRRYHESDNIFQDGYWGARVGAAEVALEGVRAEKAITNEAFLGLQGILNSAAFQAVQQDIKEAAAKVEQFGHAVNNLTTQGPMGFIEEMAKNEKADLAEQIELYNTLLKKSQMIETELKEAKHALDSKTAWLLPQQRELLGNIAQLKEDIKLEPFAEKYANKKKDYDKIKTQADGLLNTLNDIEAGVDLGADIVSQAIKLVRIGVPEITRIHVSASSATLANNEALMFSITVSWLGTDHLCNVEWAPTQEVHELYKGAAQSIAKIAKTEAA